MTRRRERRHQRADGLVLPLLLILLTMLTLIAFAATEQAITSQVAGRGLRAQDYALQKAELALRHCENQLMLGDSRLVVQAVADSVDALPQRWRISSLWFAADQVNLLPSSTDLSSEESPLLARCMVEPYRLLAEAGASARHSYLITAVGFSSDATWSPSSQRLTGTAVWLQSMLLG